MSRAIIAAVSAEGIIGIDGDIPWHYPSDMKRFKRLTMGANVIMGRLTWESLPIKPLPNRRNIVITSQEIEGVECFRDIESALESCEGDVWFIGGANIFEEAMRYADRIDLTYVPDRFPDRPKETEGTVFFPKIDETVWQAGELEVDEEEPKLKRRVFYRR